MNISFKLKNALNGIIKKIKDNNIPHITLKHISHEKKLLIHGPKIVAIGGGTGLSTMLRGLKTFSSNITAIVTVSDDGGGSGLLREDLGMLPPGDIRNCIMALAHTEPIMEKLLQYRFEEGMLKGQSFGNLFLAAMNEISSSFEEAVKKMSDVLAVTGKVLPVTLDNVWLCAELQNGDIIRGESNIGMRNRQNMSKISRVYLEPDKIIPLKEVIDSILDADIIILGPGSLYTSIIPNLLVEGVSEALKNTKAKKLYVCNVMTQPGETDGFSAYDHIKAIEKHSYTGILDYCMVNISDIPYDLKNRYLDDGAEPVKIDYEEISKNGIRVLRGEFTNAYNGFVRHDSKKLAEAIINLIIKDVLVKDKKRIITDKVS